MLFLYYEEEVGMLGLVSWECQQWTYWYVNTFVSKTQWFNVIAKDKVCGNKTALYNVNKLIIQYHI